MTNARQNPCLLGELETRYGSFAQYIIDETPITETVTQTQPAEFMQVKAASEALEAERRMALEACARYRQQKRIYHGLYESCMAQYRTGGAA